MSSHDGHRVHQTVVGTTLLQDVLGRLLELLKMGAQTKIHPCRKLLGDLLRPTRLF